MPLFAKLIKFLLIINRDFPYKLNNSQLKKVTQVNDLAVIIDLELRLDKQFDNILCKSLKMCGFIKRHTKFFHSVDAVHELYTYLVRPILEYAIVIWYPFYVICKQDSTRFTGNLTIKFNFFNKDTTYKERLLIVKYDICYWQKSLKVKFVLVLG